MFTGIVRRIGKVTRSRNGRLRVACSLGKTPRGSSVAVDGVCLTVTRRGARGLEFDMSPETLRLTRLGRLKSGERVNLEPALRAGDGVGGHWVAGHVDCVANVLRARPARDGSVTLRVRLPPGLRGLIARKGSIAVDGVSLTVTRVGRGSFETVLIPHTLRRTTLACKRAGALVHLEADLVARYVQSLLAR